MKLMAKRDGRALSIPAGLTYGATVSVILLIGLCGIVAKLVLEGILAETDAGYGVLVLLLMSSFAGALTAHRKIKRQRMMVCLLTGVLYVMILISVTALFFGGQYEAVGVTILVVLGGAISAGLIGVKEKRRRIRKKL